MSHGDLVAFFRAVAAVPAGKVVLAAAAAAPTGTVPLWAAAARTKIAVSNWAASSEFIEPVEFKAPKVATVGDVAFLVLVALAVAVPLAGAPGAAPLIVCTNISKQNVIFFYNLQMEYNCLPEWLRKLRSQ